MTRPLRLLEVFVELSDSLADDFDVVDFLRRFSSRCVELLDVSAAGILLVDEQGGLTAVAASEERILRLEDFAVRGAEGPGVECCRSGEARVNIDLNDLATVSSWVRTAFRVREAGYSVGHTLPLRVRDRIVGALDLYGIESCPLDDEQVALAQAMADIATIAVVQHRVLDRTHTLNVQLQNSLYTRIVIEQAKGILAERWNTGVDHAFHALRGYARTHELRIADLSYAIVDGRLDTRLIPPPGPTPLPDRFTSDGWPVHHLSADAWARRSWSYRAVHRKPRTDPAGEDS